jgi:NAD(P)H-dependent FMN reductase
MAHPLPVLAADSDQTQEAYGNLPPVTVAHICWTGSPHTGGVVGCVMSHVGPTGGVNVMQHGSKLTQRLQSVTVTQ